tara:strand:- start:477 stop:959 length:483 start_codon:yes stop_codon:yes gene_type:complete
MTKKLLDQLIPDFKDALRVGMMDASRKVVDDLKEEGPYWTGLFERSWVIRSGKTTIPGVLPTQPQFQMSPAGKRKTGLLEPMPINKGLEGYTIGNLTEYRAYAMDLLPTSNARRSPTFKRADGRTLVNLTANKYWFEQYVLGGAMKDQIDSTLTSIFKRY